MEELLKLKESVRERYKVVYMSIEGVKVCDKKIGISDILHEFAPQQEKVILDVARFKLFDFKAIKLHIKDLYGKNDKIYMKNIEKLKKQESEFQKLKDACDDVNERILKFKNSKTAALKTNIKLINAEDVRLLSEGLELFDVNLKDIKIEIIAELLEIAKSTMVFKINNILGKYKISSTKPEVESKITKKLKKLPTMKTLIAGVKVDKDFEVDLSDKFFITKKFRDILIEFGKGDDSLKGEVEEIVKLIKLT